MKTKKGFTLLELSIAMAVTFIAMAMVAVIMVQARTFVAHKELFTARQTETILFQKTFNTALENFQLQDFVIADAEYSNQIVFQNGQNQDIIKFSENALWKNTEILKDFTEIKNVEFSAYDNIINCKLFFDVEHYQDLIFTKRI